MQEKWLIEDVLCSFGEITRAELSPQVVELDCTEANLKNEVTHPNYKVGSFDATGKVIDPTKGGKMFCVDWKQKHLPKIWKIYKMDQAEKKFIKVKEILDKTDAIKFAENLAKGT